MTPSASAAAEINPPRKNDDDGAKSGEVRGNSQSLSNESMPSLLISEGVVSPVEEEEEILDHTPIEDDADSDGIQQQQQQQQNHNIPRIDGEVDMPSMSSSSEWEIGGRGAFADTASSSSPSTMSYYSQTRQRHREAPSHHENADDTITPKKSQTINHNGAYRTPPNPPYTPTRSTTPLSYYKKTTDDKSWLDPFPTPDVSLHSRHTTSSEEWSHVIKSIPKLPTTVEFSSPTVELKFKNNTNQQVTNTSCPELDILADDNTSSIRRVSSEASLPIIKRDSSLNTLMKRPSMEDFWSALRSGPDGNGIEIEDNRQKYDWDESIFRRKSSEDSYRKDSNLYELVDTTSDDNDARKKNVLKWRQSAPLDSSNNAVRLNNEKWEGIRKRHVGNQSSQEFVLSDNTKSFAPNGENNSATLTNVTGAGLAKEVKLLRRQRGTMTPGRIRSFLASPTVSRVRTSAEEHVFSPVRNALQQSSAATLVRNTHQKLVERKERRRQRRLARMREPPPSWWIVIPADHPYKIAWDVLTMLWSLLGAYRTHIRIRDRVFDQSPLIFLTEIWFLLDIMLNFVTEHKTRNGEVIRDGKTVWARYLTTWFVIDALSLIPWERIYVRPIVEKIKRRNFFQKTFFRSRAVVRVSRVLRGRHIKLFGRVSRQTGTPLRQLVTLIIKYVPKYLVFLRNMKGALAVRSLRLVHWLHNIYKKIWVKAKSGIYFRSKSLLAHTLRPDHSSDGDDESDSDGDDDDTGTGNGRNRDDESESGYRNDIDLLPHVSLQRSYSDSGAPVVRRRCYSSVEFSNM